MVQHQFAVLCVIALLASACTTLNIAPPAERVDRGALLGAEQHGRYWWQLRFKLTWPEGEKPDFSRHLLIADQIIAPALVLHDADIGLWRIHRRAGRTPSGHQFSVFLYTDETTARAIEANIEANPLTGWLIGRNMIEATRFDKRSKAEIAALEDTSDREWPKEIQRSWPYFIMGVSQSWLMMVQEVSASKALLGDVNYNDLLAHYHKVDDQLTYQWREFGQHAYLHHLNAVFGYRPIRIRSSEMKTF